jgi:hypothetical protein
MVSLQFDECGFCSLLNVCVRALTLEELLLELGLGDLDLDSLVDLLCVTAAVVGVVLDGGGKEGVDEGGLAEARLASDHDSEGSTALRDNLVALVRELHGLYQRAVGPFNCCRWRDSRWQCQLATLFRTFL